VTELQPDYTQSSKVLLIFNDIIIIAKKNLKNKSIPSKTSGVQHYNPNGIGMAGPTSNRKEDLIFEKKIPLKGASIWRVGMRGKSCYYFFLYILL